MTYKKNKKMNVNSFIYLVNYWYIKNYIKYILESIWNNIINLLLIKN